MHAGWTPSCPSAIGSTAPPRGAMRRASGGAAMTSTRNRLGRIRATNARSERVRARRIELQTVTRSRTVETAMALAATIGLAAISWVVAIRQMTGMDMGVATRLGSFASFVVLWVAMMLPGAAPAVLRHAHASG